MSWEMINKTDAKQFIRVPESDIQDLWYDMAQGMIEEFTGWTLTPGGTITGELVDGSGTDMLHVEQYPLSSVSSISIESLGISSSSYRVKWYCVQLLSYRGQDVTVYEDLYGVCEFPFGIGNITVSYVSGGFDYLPNRYKRATQLTMLMLVKEISENFRAEGSDQRFRSYRPDRTQNPEEVLQNYGQHGKMQGILKANLPMKRYYA